MSERAGPRARFVLGASEDGFCGSRRCSREDAWLARQGKLCCRFLQGGQQHACYLRCRQRAAPSDGRLALLCVSLGRVLVGWSRLAAGARRLLSDAARGQGALQHGRPAPRKVARRRAAAAACAAPAAAPAAREHAQHAIAASRAQEERHGGLGRRGRRRARARGDLGVRRGQELAHHRRLDRTLRLQKQRVRRAVELVAHCPAYNILSRPWKRRHQSNHVVRLHVPVEVRGDIRRGVKAVNLQAIRGALSTERLEEPALGAPWRQLAAAQTAPKPDEARLLRGGEVVQHGALAVLGCGEVSDALHRDHGHGRARHHRHRHAVLEAEVVGAARAVDIKRVVHGAIRSPAPAAGCVGHQPAHDAHRAKLRDDKIGVSQREIGEVAHGRDQQHGHVLIARTEERSKHELAAVKQPSAIHLLVTRQGVLVRLRGVRLSRRAHTHGDVMRADVVQHAAR
mmetsp:Transcript_6376/g.16308  ORF Transcript_6376/g.16308 Transcript_6376/m.16308 type:complete len:455 (+) Transcript_6376:168-1532(+)